MRFIKNRELSADVLEKDWILGCCAALLASFLFALLAFNRNYFTYAETDYIARNLADAERLLRGEPMLLDFHPPFYSIVLAAFHGLFRDWLTAGLVVSWFSSVTVLITSFLFFHSLGGRYAAWGSLLGMMSSRLFLSYSCFATQDMFFLALYSSCFLLAFLAMQRDSKILWGFTGVFLACGLLTRTNGLTLLTLLASPFLQLRNVRDRLKDLACILAACIVVLTAWGGVAKLTGSPLGPQFGPVNLARRYFPVEGDPFTFEAVQLQISLFPSYKDVFLRDPKHMAVTYVKDSFQNMKRTFMSTELLAFPTLLFSLPGIFILFFKPTNVFALFFLVATVFQVSLLGFKEFEPRYYLFLIPALAAGAGTCIQFIWEQISQGWKRTVVLILFLPLLISGVKETRYTLAATYEDLHAQDEELGEVTSVARKLVDPRGVFVCRGIHLPFYLGIREVGFPDFKNLEEFHVWLNSLTGGGPIYVYFGPDEKQNRQSMDLGSAERAPNWLKPVAQSPVRNKWILYRYDRAPSQK